MLAPRRMTWTIAPPMAISPWAFGEFDACTLSVMTVLPWLALPLTVTVLACAEAVRAFTNRAVPGESVPAAVLDVVEAAEAAVVDNTRLPSAVAAASPVMERRRTRGVYPGLLRCP